MWCIFAFQTSSDKVSLKQRPFDFTKYNFRHVALKIAYLGWDYQVCIYICDLDVSEMLCVLLLDECQKSISYYPRFYCMNTLMSNSIGELGIITLMKKFS